MGPQKISPGYHVGYWIIVFGLLDRINFLGGGVGGRPPAFVGLIF